MSHAILSPSAASRWMACTPSARLEQQFPDSAGEAAKEGTLAHSLAEVVLLQKTGQINALQAKDRTRKIQQHALYKAEMTGYIEEYTAHVIEAYSAARATTADAVIHLEQKLDLTAYVPEGFGTGDVVIIADGILDIIDLKYGKGVPVFADNNKQMMLYALGALYAFDFLYDVHTVRMTIHQPRLDTVSTWEINAAELKQWAESELKPKALLAFAGQGQYAAGEHCRFCRAKGVCRANADFNLELAKHDFADADLLGDDEVAAILGRADLFTKWLKGVTDYALAQALAGKKWPNWKLVEGRSNRAYGDPAAIESALVEAKVTVPIHEPKKLLGLTALQGAIGKPLFDDLVGPYLIKPPGKPSLVAATDKRPELNSLEAARADFDDETE